MDDPVAIVASFHMLNLQNLLRMEEDFALGMTRQTEKPNSGGMCPGRFGVWAHQRSPWERGAGNALAD